MDLPIETFISALCAKPFDFNLIHFKDATHDKNAPAHFWVSISISSDQPKYLLLSIVTTQMQNLEKRYRADDEEQALESLVPLSSSDLKRLTEPCVINCNATMLLSTQQLLERIDTSVGNHKIKNYFKLIHCDKDFNSELKSKIIHAIKNSPYVLPEVTKCVNELR